jgi:hypothetical protein
MAGPPFPHGSIVVAVALSKRLGHRKPILRRFLRSSQGWRDRRRLKIKSPQPLPNEFLSRGYELGQGLNLPEQRLIGNEMPVQELMVAGLNPLVEWNVALLQVLATNEDLKVPDPIHALQDAQSATRGGSCLEEHVGYKGSEG